ncbi:MerR family transcriptional regulator [Phytomonospora endophytica]|uniref:DNA-binding transcriptional MerR regulator n=1 Tax=Phytomonospora endophytica TaxID=714109 RepID=A0A841FMJ2_9ACTN|nr:MerR family transcriptional regulator [Phytomonospora endophytica]MBB6035018.1 DNA-binding transcriptional MerR regulator [Phytomonospora endophytica]GIG68272.1 MerR family transcriptional regulator [Phytomonospora endophytica]
MTYTVENVRDAVTVGEAAELAGVTVRTLHHWDEIGLASPSVRTSAGYRRYTDEDLQRLDRVVAYREAGLGLETVREVLDDATAEIGAALREQRARLAERIEELRRLDERLERLTESHERGILLDDEAQTEIFGEDWDAPRSRRARAVWGDSTQWAQFAERSASRTKEQWKALSGAMSALQLDLGDAVDRDVVPGSPEANALIERHREVFSNFFPLTRQMQVCLGRMFESDPGFAAHYDGIRAGLTSWFRRSIDENARANGVDPETAAWR